MMDNYQAVYDAVRASIRNGDIGHAVENAIGNAGISFQAQMASNMIQAAAAQYERPSVLYRPRLFISSGKWCASYNEMPYNKAFTTSLIGIGDSPAEAMADFDKKWHAKI
jgi:hypothetical protein